MTVDRQREQVLPAEDAGGCCGGGSCGPAPITLSRRTFLAAGAAGVASLAMAGEAAAALGLDPQRAVVVPVDKGLSKEKVAALFDRGSPTEYTGDALARIGMPVGGGCCGQVYLSGDGRLWLWDVCNPDAFPYGGADWQGLHYADPLEPAAPFATGFALRTTVDGRTTTRRLDSGGFAEVRFVGQYPIGRVTFTDPGCPVAVTLEAYSPFVPGVVTDSTMPVILMDYTLRNTSGSAVTAELLGFTEHPVCLQSRRSQPIRLRANAFTTTGGKGVDLTAAAGGAAAPQPDIVFEDWERADYSGWTVTGTAFGAGPVTEAETPDYFRREGPLNIAGTRFVTSHHFRAGGDIPAADSYQGKLTSRTFTVERKHIVVAVGGGNHPGQTCVNVVVGGQVVASATGADSEPLRQQWLDVSVHMGQTATIEIVDAHTGEWGHVNCDRIIFTDRPAPRPDIVFEDWERTDYSGWTVTGTAFGAGPVTEAETPDYFRRQGPLNLTGTRFVTSHNWRAGSPPADEHTGKLTSRPFTISRRYVAARVGGGAHPGKECVNVVVDGTVVASFTGRNFEPLTLLALDVSGYEGRTATIEIVDDATGGWAHINCDRIVFTDIPVSERPLDQLPDAGSFALTAFADTVQTRPSIADWSTPDALFDSADGQSEVDGGRATIASTVTVPLTLAADATRSVRYAFSWYFPTVNRQLFSYLTNASQLRRHYSETFASARAVADHIGAEGDRLAADTRAFVRTWYTDSTLPHWFLERTLAPASTVATSTCHRFQDGRFYAWEGLYCCDGTCTHVWNYAQSIARLLPELERDTRERIDFGISFHSDTGAIDYRGEAARHVAHDGQCGNILRTYREHQMAPDGAFLARVWPRVKLATQFLIRHDGEPDGILEGEQYNTLDASWYGEIPWISGLYVAALRAAAEMATDVGDTAFAAQCRTLADRGTQTLGDSLWNDRYGYFEQHIDPAHRDAINSNRGCHLDQLYGECYAHQLALPRVFPADKSRTALTNMYRNNFLPDAQSYRDVSGIPGGRVFSTDGEAGTLLCTWPFGGSDTAPGSGEPYAIGYFNEVWTGLEYQFAAHLIADGMVTEGMAVTRAVYDRYHATKRNPYNEIECSDHYARAMMSHAVYLAATGFSYHGPRGHLGFAPRVSTEDFAAAFTVAQGWGRFRQVRDNDGQTARVELRHGKLKLRSLALALPADAAAPKASARVIVRDVARPVEVAAVQRNDADGLHIMQFQTPVTLVAGHTLEVVLPLS